MNKKAHLQLKNDRVAGSVTGLSCREWRDRDTAHKAKIASGRAAVRKVKL